MCIVLQGVVCVLSYRVLRVYCPTGSCVLSCVLSYRVLCVVLCVVLQGISFCFMSCLCETGHSVVQVYYILDKVDTKPSIVSRCSEIYICNGIIYISRNESHIKK